MTVTKPQAQMLATPAAEPKQTVVVTRHADRHASSEREFAVSYEIVVKADHLWRVLHDVIGRLPDLPDPARYTLTVSEPFE